MKKINIHLRPLALLQRITILLLVLFNNLLFSQASYYVDGANGNDSNPGTSLNQAWKTIQQAFDAATAGSIVYIKGGTYNENIITNVSGTIGNPITFTNYQSDIVILDGTNTPHNDLLYIENQSNLIIKNISIQNKTINNATGLTISCTPDGFVSNITLKNLKISAINWTADANAIPASNNNSNPILIYGQGTDQANAIKNIVIDSCEVFNNITGFSEAISLDGNVDSFTVSNNHVHDNKNIGILMGGNYKVSSNTLMDHARNGKCFLNKCSNNVSLYATSAGIYVDGGQKIIVERNLSYGNGYGIEIGCEENGSTSGITVRDNIIYNNKEAGLAIGGYTSSTTGQVLNTIIRNNTFLKNDYSNSGMGEVYISKMSNCKIQNNIFYTNSQNILISKDNITPFNANEINYNCWYTPNNNSNSILVNWGTNTYSTFSNYIAGTGMDVNSFYADPLITNLSIITPDMHLTSSSPCIDKGLPTFVADINETDFYGGIRVLNNKVDVGAHEATFPTDVVNTKYNSGLLISPNPSFGEVNIINLESAACNVDVYNTLGCKIHSFIFQNNGTYHIELKKGIYIYVINCEGKINTEKIIIQ